MRKWAVEALGAFGPVAATDAVLLELEWLLYGRIGLVGMGYVNASVGGACGV